MEGIKEFFMRYRGAIIGGIVAIIVLALQIYKVVVGIFIILAGLLIGNYVQYNKEFVKEKIKSFIDKL